MSRIITTAGQKGGTGKSITAVNLAASLALIEKNTLLIDFDPRGCSTQFLGIGDADFKCDIASVLSGRARFPDAIVKTQLSCLDIMPAGFNLFQVGLRLAKTFENEKILRLFLKDVEEAYEYIIIDSPSSYSYLSASALTAADWLLVCMSVHDNSTKDFHCLLQMMKYIRASHDVTLKIAGLVFNRCETKEEIQSFLENQGLQDVEQMVYKTFIPDDENIKHSIELKIPVALHDMKSPAAQAFLSLAKEMHSFFN